jgi:Domain of unknown function (DUF222)
MSEFGVTGDGRLDALAGDGWRDEPGSEAAWLEDEAAGWWPGDEDIYGDPDPLDPALDEEAEHASWLAGLPADVRAEYEAGPWTGEGESVPAGFLHGDLGRCGAGFASGGALDGLVPGPLLAKLTAAAVRGKEGGGHVRLGESELIGVLRAWRRLASWAQAGEAGAVCELAIRRGRQARDLDNPHLAEHVDDEVAAALTMTGRSAGRLTSVAAGLARLPEVLAALARGEIDWARACVLVDELAGLGREDAAEIARSLLDRAGGWTTGQLRAALRRAVLAFDPDAARRRRETARKDAEVQAWDEQSGNAALAGRELPPAEVIAADNRLTALARWLKGHGAAGTIARLRAAAYLALLAGRPVSSLLPAPASRAGTGHSGALNDVNDTGAPHDTSNTGAPNDMNGAAAPADPVADSPAGFGTGADAAPGAHPATDAEAASGPSAAGWPQLGGSVNLTLPMTTWAGLTDTPGEVAGHGPVDDGSCRDLAAMMGTSARWCVTLTGPDGRAVGHACARRAPPPPGPDFTKWAAGLKARLMTLETGDCSHGRESARYTPPANLTHLICIRQRTCCFPGCRRAAVRSDIDHTIPYHLGGRTCECNVAPLCRLHHRAKQAPRWMLEQTEPGLMTWHLPSGRTYSTIGDAYPV